MMSTYAVDSTAQQMRATGIVDPVYDWIDDAATGRRRQSETPARDAAGLPLWAVEAQYIAVSFGRQSTVVCRVTVPAVEIPTLAPFEVVPFVGLTVAVSVPRGGSTVRESWRADSIAAASSGSSRTRDAA